MKNRVIIKKMKLFNFLKSHGRVLLLIATLSLSLYSTFLFLTVGQRGYDNDLLKLAGRFLSGHLSLSIYNLPIRDIAGYFNNYYIYFGPLSSLLLIPIYFLFKESVSQVILGVFSLVVSFISAYFIGRKFNFSKIDSLWLSTFFVFSTVVFSSAVINNTAYQVEVLAVPFMLLSLLFYFKKKNPLISGLFLGLAIMTRFTLMLAVIFFVLEVLQKRFSLKHFILFLIPVILSVSILGAYNYRRFHTVLENGYHYNISLFSEPISYNLKYGDASLIHIPANLYSLLVIAPDPLLKNKDQNLVLKFPYVKANPWGMAIWFTSPLFLFLLTNFKLGKYSLSSIITGIILSLPVLTWYSIGYAQVGYRYALDFLPFLFLILLPVLQPKLTKHAIFLIIIGVIFNCIIVDSIWETYPLFNIYP